MRRATPLACLLAVACGGGQISGQGTCGDAECTAPAESCASCPADCGGCDAGDPDCGNGACDPEAESCVDCPVDCGACPPDAVCGDGACDGEVEACGDCPADCGECPAGWDCGDGACNADFESCLDCPDDCGICPPPVVCGDSACEAGEDCSSCQADCGACPHCGNGACETEELETCGNCAIDCGACDPCGDGMCDGPAETCSTCPADCGACDRCGDHVCRSPETCSSCPEDCDVCEMPAGCHTGRFSAYWGNVHSHTSYSDGVGTPAIAFSHARNAGLDFLMVTDHKGQMSDGQWQGCLHQADLKNKPGTFVASCGYEIVINTTRGNGLGHFNALFANRRMTTPVGLKDLYQTLANCASCVGQWNHPPWPGTFAGYQFFAVGRPKMRAIEFSGRGSWADKLDAYFRALRNGWKISPSMNEDNHTATWGDRKWATGVWSTALSRTALREAFEDNRTFATGDDTARIALKAENCWMGSVIHGYGPIRMVVNAADRQNGDGFKRIALRGPSGAVIAQHSCNGQNPCSTTFLRRVNEDTFFVATAVQSDGDALVSAPIWIVK